MKKYSVALLLGLLSLSAMAQIPSGYYTSAEGKTGSDLRAALSGIIDGHTNVGYDGLWNVYKTSDTMHYNGQVYVWDMYSTRADRSASYYYKPGVGQCGNYSGEGSCYNREHSVPKSWFDDKSPMYSDAFHLVPTDGKVNGQRSNYPFGEVGSATWTSTNGSKLGNAKSGLGYSGTVFEPIDVYKGDFARGYFYMATRYMSGCSTWGGGMFGSENKGFKNWAIQMLIRWHEQDPVSQKEINRNNEIYKYQKNRNPFIDHPEYVNAIWGSGTIIPPTESVTVSSVSMLPTQPKPADAPVVSASVTATGVTVSSVYLKYGTISNLLKDSVAMTLTSGVYKATLAAKSEGTTIYYAVAAKAGALRSVSSTRSYTVSSSVTPPPPGPSDSTSQIFFEDCGTTATKDNQFVVADYTGWKNYGAGSITFGGTANARGTSSLNSHVWFASNSEKSLSIEGINTSGCDSIRLSFKMMANGSNGNASKVTVACVDAQGQSTMLTIPSQPIANSTSDYTTVSNIVGVPATESLKLTFAFTATNNTVGYRIDDIEITGKSTGQTPPATDVTPPSIIFMDMSYNSQAVNAWLEVQDAQSGVRSVTMYWGQTEGDTTQGKLPLVTEDASTLYYVNEAINIPLATVYATFVAYDSAGNRATYAYVCAKDPDDTPIDNDTLKLVMADYEYSNGDFDISVEVQNARQGVQKVWLYLGVAENDTTFGRYPMQKNGDVYSASFTPNFSYATLYITIIAYDNAGRRAELHQAQAKNNTPVDPTAIADVERGVALKLYPNPTSAELNLQLPDNALLQRVEVFDMQGTRLLELRGGTSRINLAPLRQNGIYLVRVTTSDGVGYGLFNLIR